MNDRIRLLADQCREEYPDTEWPDATHYRFDEAKFAELIVEECVSVVMGGSFLHDEAPGAQFARECSAAIKRHFEK